MNNLKNLNNNLYVSNADKLDITDAHYGKIFKIDVKNQITKTGKSMRTYFFYVNDNTSSVILSATLFDIAGAEKTISDLEDFKVNDYVSFTGVAKKDKYTRNQDWNIGILGQYNVSKIKHAPELKDTLNMEEENITIQPDSERVEFLSKTKFSTQDSLTSPEDLIKHTLKLGRKQFAVSDFQASQAFPEIQNAVESYNSNKDDDKKLTPIYASSLQTTPSIIKITENETSLDFHNKENYVVYDIETTGLSPMYDEIIEIGAIKYVDGVKTNFQTFVKPTKSIPSEITKLTSITDEMVVNAPTEVEALKSFLEFVGDNKIIAGHNIINFDNNFIQAKINKNKIESNFAGLPKLDTMQLSRALFKQRSHRLEKLCSKVGVEYNTKISHRADYDADVNLQALNHILENGVLPETGILKEVNSFNQINKNLQTDLLKSNMNFPSNVTIYLRQQNALRDFNQLVSQSLTTDFMGFGSPRIIEEHLFENPSVKNLDILVTNGVTFNCDIFQTALTKNINELQKAISKYHFISLPPIENFSLEFESKIVRKSAMENVYKRIMDAATKNEVPVIAVSNSSYETSNQKQYYDIMTSFNMIGGKRHPMFRSIEVENNEAGAVEKITLTPPDLSIKSTQYLKQSFNFLRRHFDEKTINDIITTNTTKLAKKFGQVAPMKRGLFAPELEGCAQSLTDNVWKQAKEIYGEILPEVVQARLEKELNSILKHKFEVVYWISHLLVKKSNEDGFLVGSRGSVGSSLVATMLGITEVNPLTPHYICKDCKHSDFSNPSNALSGFDMPTMNCPKCNIPMLQEGHDIPFETFLGFEGDKVPDIDLNFAGEYQPKAHNFLKELLGEDKAFRAGTIGTLAETSSVNETEKYFKFIKQEKVSSAECERIADKLVGIKKTTGQHPGGIIVVPKDLSIFDFTPINFPASDQASDWYTTHNEFSHIHDNLLKFDILGHDDPTLLHYLQEITGINPVDIPLNDEEVRKNVLAEFNGDGFGLPEFGTAHARGAVAEMQPKTFADLIALSGLLHGTDVYVGNIRDIILNENKTLSEVPSCRDNIMVDLIKKGLSNKEAFDIMEHVRKGKSLTEQEEILMRKFNVDESYIKACKKIKYMFPKAHAAAYVHSAYRIAYFKKYYPEAFYAAWLSFKKGEFELSTIKQGEAAMNHRIEDIEKKGFNATPIEKEMVPTFQIMIELLSKGIKLLDIDLNNSLADTFIPNLTNHTLLPPLSAIKGLGEKVAQKIKDERSIKPFENYSDLKTRTKINKSQMFSLIAQGITSEAWAKEFLKKHLTEAIMNKTDLKKVQAGDVELLQSKYEDLQKDLIKDKDFEDVELLRKKIFTTLLFDEITNELKPQMEQLKI